MVLKGHNYRTHVHYSVHAMGYTSSSSWHRVGMWENTKIIKAGRCNPYAYKDIFALKHGNLYVYAKDIIHLG